MKLVLALGILVLGWPAPILAQSGTPSAGLDVQSPAAPGVHVVDDSEPKSPLVPRAKDLLRGHVLAGASVGTAWSLGKLGSDLAAVRGLGPGLSLQADAGFGLSRSAAVGVWGNYTRYRDGDGCDRVSVGPFATEQACSAYSFSVGPFVRYHLSQGLRFDPWILLGGGYRRVSFEQISFREDEAPPISTEAQTFSGLSWLRLELGADYYVWSGIGVGPFGALSLSSYTKRPDDAGNAAVNTELSFGLRVLLDVPGR